LACHYTRTLTDVIPFVFLRFMLILDKAKLAAQQLEIPETN
jgi:hypothetical protein